MSGPALHFGRDSFESFESGIRQEWLLSNGIGGFASSTILGAHTRRYHGLLVAALNPPAERTLLLSGFDEEYIYRGVPRLLSCYEFADRTVHPKGFSHVLGCSVEPHCVTWRFGWEDLLLEKRVWMEPGENTVFVQYDCLRAGDALQITLRPLCARRDYHSHQRGEFDFTVESSGKGLSVGLPDQSDRLHLAASAGSYENHPVWYWNFFHRAEELRGLDAVEDLFIPGTFSVELAPHRRITLCASTKNGRILRAAAALKAADKRHSSFTKAIPKDAPQWVHTLAAHSRHFIIERRAAEKKTPGASVIAGYPWFTDWTRDTMISLPGLMLATGNKVLAKQVLRTFASFVSEGMLPNRFLDAGDEAEYNSVDASLLFIAALDEYFQHTNDAALLKSLLPVVEEICTSYTEGTRHGIGVDPEDGLLRAGEAGLQLTWMDAKVGDWVVTPREGKPVEINALWYNALEFLAESSKALGKKTQHTKYRERARGVKQSFAKFWNEKRGYLFDVLGPPDDDTLRPNQLFAAALRHSPLTRKQQRAIVDCCAERLVTPWGLRTLDPGHPDYRGSYQGGPRERDGSYHQGTVWPWLIGIFIRAHLKVYKKPAAALSYLEGLRPHIREAGIGHISEIFDGGAPHRPRGCFAQAWSSAEMLFAWHACRQAEKNGK